MHMSILTTPSEAPTHAHSHRNQPHCSSAGAAGPGHLLGHILPLRPQGCRPGDLLSHRQHVEARKLLACPSLWQFPLLLLMPLPSDHVQVREQRPSWESDLPGSVVGPCPLECFL